MNKDTKMIELINTHYNLEMASYNLYNQLSMRLSIQGYNYASKLIKELADDKVTSHVPRIYEYLLSIDQELIANDFILPKDVTESNEILDIFNFILNNEMILRKHVKYLANYSISINDFETFNFLQWFVKDCVKDINEIKSIIGYMDGSSDKISLELIIQKLKNY